MNISFAKLGNEECEPCGKHNLHKLSHTENDNIVECEETDIVKDFPLPVKNTMKM